MISKRTSDEELKKRLEKALRENIKKRKAQKELRKTEEEKSMNLIKDDKISKAF